jgi:hypothetical protein
LRNAVQLPHRRRLKVISQTVTKPNIPAWWSDSSADERRQQLKACGLNQNLVSKPWGELNGKEQAALRREYTETHEDDE